MCNCNSAAKGAGVQAAKVVFEVNVNGSTTTFSDENEARIFATMKNGRLTIKTK